jgi:hypothetical protein
MRYITVVAYSGERGLEMWQKRPWGVKSCRQKDRYGGREMGSIENAAIIKAIQLKQEIRSS